MGKRIYIYSICMLVFFTTRAQQHISQTRDSLHVVKDSLKTIFAETVVSAQKKESTAINKRQDVIRKKTDSIIELTSSNAFFANSRDFKPSPKKAVLYSALFPGLGQIYNRKYWKLPILYGGFIGLSYAISWNNRYYQDYYGAFKDISDNDDTTNRWHNFLRYNETPESARKEALLPRLKEGKDFYRYYRDLSIILTAALYGLGIVDAYVDAQLFDFDISPDLSMRIEPVILGKGMGNNIGNSFGLQCSINF